MITGINHATIKKIKAIRMIDVKFNNPPDWDALIPFLSLPHWVDFIGDLRAWIDNGMPKDDIFHHQVGICKNYKSYLVRRDFSTFAAFVHARRIRTIFRQEYPFNKNESKYAAEASRDATYKNKKRLNFIYMIDKTFRF